MPKVYIERKSNVILDIIKLQKQGYTDIHFKGYHLTGGVESSLPYKECYFGKVDSKDSNLGLDTLHPIYQLISEVVSNSIDSKTHNKESNNTLSTLNIFLNNSTLTLLNYSLLDSSLNIKLECNSKESKAILEKEQAQRERDSSLTAQNDNSTNIAFLHPILEDNILKCPHNGAVKLKSNKGKNFKSNNIPMILESDLLHSSIIGCTNNIAGIPTPCTQVALILPNARALKKYNNDYPIMQDLVNGNVFSDKGFPLICTPKPNKFKIQAAIPTQSGTISKEALISSIDTSIPSFCIITEYRELDEFYLTPSFYENRECKESLIASQSHFYTTYKPIDIRLDSLHNAIDCSGIESHTHLKDIVDSLLPDYSTKYFSYRILSIRIAYSVYEYLFIIPKRIPKFILKLLKEQRHSDELDFGYGSFVDLQRDYVRESDTAKDNENNKDLCLLHIQGKVFLAPSGMQRVRVEVW